LPQYYNTTKLGHHNTNHMFSELIIGTMRLGTWDANYNTAQWQGFIEDCLSLGMTTFDHADIYGDYSTETDFGKVLKNAPQLRERLQIITKCGICRVCENRPQYRIKSYDSSKAHIMASVDNSLRELQTEYIDMLLLHRPDYLMEPDEIAEAFTELLAEGKVKSFGVSNFTPSQFQLLNEAFPLATNQIEVSITARHTFEDGTLDQCMRHGIRPQAWSPLGGGVIFGENEVAARVKKVAQALIEKHNASLDQILLAWLRRHPAQILPVLGTTKIERVKTAANALDIQLDRVEWYDIWQAATGEKIA